jgi:hypothetical protein
MPVVVHNVICYCSSKYGLTYKDEKILPFHKNVDIADDPERQLFICVNQTFEYVLEVSQGI